MGNTGHTLYSGEVSGEAIGDKLDYGELTGVQLHVAPLRGMICSGTMTKVRSGNHLLVTASVLT